MKKKDGGPPMTGWLHLLRRRLPIFLKRKWGQKSDQIIFLGKMEEHNQSGHSFPPCKYPLFFFLLNFPTKSYPIT